MPSLRVDRMRTQCDDSEEAACDVGRVGAVGWFGQCAQQEPGFVESLDNRLAQNLAIRGSPGLPNRPRLGGASTVWPPLNCAPNSEGRGET